VSSSAGSNRSASSAWPGSAKCPRVEDEFPWGPYGAKGLGETPIIAVAPAVTNAIAHATGVRLRQIPATPERVFSALRAREAPGAGAPS